MSTSPLIGRGNGVGGLAASGGGGGSTRLPVVSSGLSSLDSNSTGPPRTSHERRPSIRAQTQAQVAAAATNGGGPHGHTRRPNSSMDFGSLSPLLVSPGLPSANGGGTSSDFDARLAVLERTCHRLVSLQSSSGSLAALSSSLETLETRTASLEPSLRRQWEEHSAEAIARSEDSLAARIDRLESRTVAAEAEARAAHEMARQMQRVASTDEKTSPTLAAEMHLTRIEQIEKLVADESARHCSDFDTLSATLARQFTRTHLRLTSSEEARHAFEDGFKTFVVKFQGEFRGIVAALQKQVTKAHTQMEKVLRAEIEARLEAERATSASNETRFTSLTKEFGALRLEQTRLSSDVSGKLAKGLEQARAAAGAANTALAKADTAVTDAVAAREVAARTAARVQANSNGVAAVAAAARATPATLGSTQTLPIVVSASSSNSSSSTLTAAPASTAASVSPTAGAPGHGKNASTSGGGMLGVPKTRAFDRRPSGAGASLLPTATTTSTKGHTRTPSSGKAADNSSPSKLPSTLPSATTTSSAVTASSSSKPVTSAAASAASAAIKSQLKLPGATKTPVSASPSASPPSTTPKRPSASSTSSTSSTATTTAAAATVLDRDVAATRIQSLYRGFAVRRAITRDRLAGGADPDSSSSSGLTTATGAALDALLAANVSDATSVFTAPPPVHTRGDLLTDTLESMLSTVPAPFGPLQGQVVAVVVGMGHAAALSAQGLAFLWGSNTEGQLGLGDRLSRASPTPLSLTRIAQVALGHEHSLARLADGSVFAWGSGMLGRLGLRSDEDQELPQRLTTFPPHTRILHLAAGQYNSGFIAAPTVVGGPNQLFICGANEEGQCALGHRTPQLTPALVTTLPTGVSLTRLAFGDKHGVAVSSSGDVFSWGSGEFGATGLGPPTNPDDSTSNHHQLTPALVEHLRTLRQHAVDVACGERHTHVVTRAGALWSFGSGESHQIGVMDNVDQFRPVKVDLPAPCLQVSAGAAASYAVLETGDAYAWGFGTGSAVPRLQEVLRGSFIQALGVGSNELVVALTGEAQECFRWTFDEPDATPTLFEAVRGRRLADLSVGASHHLFVDGGGRLLASGTNTDYQLGTGNTFDLPLPTPISLPVRIASVAAAAMHSVALGVDGSVWSWGNAAQGRCGVGTDGDVVRPTLLDSLRDIKMKFVTASQYNSGAISVDGVVYAWGSGDGAQIGVEGFAPQLRPVRVPLLEPGTNDALRAVSLSFGNRHAVVVSESGAALSWGNNEFGQLGLGLVDQPGSVDPSSGAPLQRRPSHIALLAGTPLRAAFAGENVTFFLARTGDVFACGSGETSQLGLGSGGGAAASGGVQEDQPVPSLLTAFRTAGVRIARIAVGALNCIAVTEEGRVWAWGWALGETPTPVEQLKDKKIKSATTAGTCDTDATQESVVRILIARLAHPALLSSASSGAAVAFSIVSGSSPAARQISSAAHSRSSPSSFQRKLLLRIHSASTLPTLHLRRRPSLILPTAPCLASPHTAA